MVTVVSLAAMVAICFYSYCFYRGWLAATVAREITTN